MIENNNLLGDYILKDLEKIYSIDIDENISLEELDNLKYINNYCIINLYSNNINKISKTLSVLKDSSKSNLITINVENKDKNELTKFFLDNDISGNNIYIRSSDSRERIKLSNYLKYEKTLNDMVSPALNLSPFERYIYAYNISKQFKKYKNNKDFIDTKMLYNIMDNEYVVCKGFTALFSDLLNKLGIGNIEINFGVDSSYTDEDLYGLEFKEIKSVNAEGHARVYVYISDKKYNIDGFYMSDPTWDNNLEKDFYNHMIMTDEETTYNSDYIWLDLEKQNFFTGESYFDIFNVKNMEEYIIKMKFIMNKDYEVLLEIIRYILKVIQNLDNIYYNELVSKYPYIKELDFVNNITSLVYDLGEYIISKVNKIVSGETIFKGVKEIYKYSYGYQEDNLDYVLENVREYNKERHESSFPKRYKIDKDGKYQVVMNENNKFDFKFVRNIHLR